MAFIPNQQYVAPDPSGGYDVYVGGKKVGTYSDQSSAEQAYNAATGASNTPSGGGTYTTPQGTKSLADMQAGLHQAGWGGNYDDPNAVYAAYSNLGKGLNADGTPVAGGASGLDPSYQKMMDAIASGNQQQFDEAVREFNAKLQEQQSEFQGNQYSQLAQNLLDTASKLTGPSDYFQFQKYASGGRSLMDQLFGNQPRAAFTAAQGPNSPMDIQTLMQDLGFRTAPGATGSSVSSTPGMYNTVNGQKSLDQMLAELKTAGWGPAQGGTRPSDQDIVSQYQNTTKSPVTPYATSTSTSTSPTPMPMQVDSSVEQQIQKQTQPQVSGMTSPVNTSTPTLPSTQPPQPSSGAGTPPAPAATSGSAIPVYDQGGAIPGQPGQHILAVLESGEKVTPPPYKQPPMLSLPTSQPSSFGQTVSSMARQGPGQGFGQTVSGMAQSNGQQPQFPIGPLPPTPAPGTGTAQPMNDLPVWQAILGHMLGGAANNGRVPVFDSGGLVSGFNAGSTVPQPANGPNIFYHPVSPTDVGSITGPPGSDAPKQWDWRNTGTFPTAPALDPNAFTDKLAKTSPFQINPAQWDALGNVGQQLVLSAVKANGWDTTEWLAQLNAQRPTGTAPKQVLTQYYQPSSGGGNAAPAGVY